MKLRSRGFTLIELIVVIAIIGILATLTVVGFNRFSAETRDAQRKSSATVIAEALEKHYDEHGEYPGCLEIENDASVVASETLQGLDPTVLVAPQADGEDNNSIECVDGPELSMTGTDFFEYEGDDSEACQSGSSCLAFILRYRDENDGQIKEITSRRHVQFLQNITLTGSAVDSVSAQLNWNSLDGAVDYTIQRADDSSFSTGLTESSSETNSTIVTGLSQGDTYYFRVRANATGTQSNWSNTVSVTTLDLDGPVITSTSSTTSSITVNWQAVENATSYRFEYSTSSNFSGSIQVNGITSTSHTVTGLPVGTLYFVKIYAVSGSVVGDPSNVVQVNTTINAPAAPIMATPTNVDNSTSYTTTWTWSANGSCPSGTSMQFRNQYGYNSSSNYMSSWSSASTTTTRQVTTSQGYTYTVYAQARCISSTNSNIYSPWSSTTSRSYTQPVTAPTSVSFSFTKEGSKIVHMSATVNGCRSGASKYGHFVEYSRDIEWVSGPNDGNPGWWDPDGWRITNTTNFSGGVQNSYNIPNGSGYKFKVQVWCRNSTTGVKTGGTVYTSSTWEW